ncbi:MAG: hypothetical protein K1X86_10965 [Ignavibacteria bacterium]|nr:hypothetical protein [Ignavibacteria bacterium]
METISGTLVLIGAAIVCVLFIVFYMKRFTSKTYVQKTSAMLDTIEGVAEIGLQRTETGYSGPYRDFHVHIFATTAPGALNNRYQVVVGVAPEPGQLKSIGGFFSNYFVMGEQPGFAYAGFILNPNMYNDAEQNLKRRLDVLIDMLVSANVKPYKA